MRGLQCAIESTHAMRWLQCLLWGLSFMLLSLSCGKFGDLDAVIQRIAYKQMPWLFFNKQTLQRSARTTVSICVSVTASVCPSALLFQCLSIWLNLYLSLYFSVCPSCVRVPFSLYDCIISTVTNMHTYYIHAHAHKYGYVHSRRLMVIKRDSMANRMNWWVVIKKDFCLIGINRIICLLVKKQDYLSIRITLVTSL